MIEQIRKGNIQRDGAAEAAEAIPAAKIPVVRFNYGKLVESAGGRVTTGHAITRKSTGFEGPLPYDPHGVEISQGMLYEYGKIGALGLKVLPNGNLLTFRERRISEAGEGKSGRAYGEMAGLIMQNDWRRHASQLADTMVALRADSEVRSTPLNERSNYKEPDIDLPQHTRVSYKGLDPDAKYLADIILAEQRATQYIDVRFASEGHFFKALTRAMEAVDGIQPEKLTDLNAAYGFNRSFVPKKGDWIVCLPATFG